MPIWGHVELLCRAVSEEGRKEGEKIIAQARAEAERVVAEARERADGEFEKKILIAKTGAYAEAKRIVDSAELEAKKRIMGFREEFIQSTWEALEQHLRQMPNDPEYGDYLLSAMREGIEALPGKRYVVEVNHRDGDRLREEAERLAGELNLEIELKEAPSLEGGPRIYTGDGRLLFDNTLSARLKRRESKIRREIWRTILGSD